MIFESLIVSQLKVGGPWINWRPLEICFRYKKRNNIQAKITIIKRDTRMRCIEYRKRGNLRCTQFG